MSVCIFGDSIAWGLSDSDKGGWVERLRVHIKEKYEDEVYNLGISGDNTDDLLKRVEAECRAREPSIIVFAIGVNDSQYVHSEDKRRVSLDRFNGNIRKLYKIAQKFTDKVAFVGLTEVDEQKTSPIPWNTDKSYDNDSIKQYDGIIRKFCEENGLKFIAIDGVLQLEDLEDGLHPKSQGHEKLFNKIRPEIEEILAV